MIKPEILTLEFRSREFSFERGSVWLIASDWEEGPLSRQEVPSALPLEQNRIEKAPVCRPGEFQLIFEKLSAIRRSDGRTFVVPAFLVPELVRISNYDITKGTAIIALEPDGPYQLTLFDPRDHRPLAHWPFSFSANASNFRIDTDERGAIIFLSKPTLYRLELKKNMGMTIVPV